MNEQDLRKIIEDQLALSRRLKAKIEAMEAEQHAPIAIVGMGFRLPGGIDCPNAYWDFLQGEGDALSDIPDNRPSLKAVFDPITDQLGKSYVNRAGFLADVEHFDAKFFGISAREAEALDPQQRLLLETSWEAMERAGIAVRRNERLNAGVFVGIMASEYPERRLGLKDKTTIDPYFGTGGGHCFAAGRISYAMGFSGPAMSVDTACSSSLVALHLAARSLRNGECRYALVGGTNLIFSADLMVSLCQSKALAPDGRSKTFTSEADGYGRGEGIGTLVLMPLADAKREGRPILALLRGTAVNHDGASSGLTVPSGPAQQEVIAAALKDARCDPADIAYVEAHGTGTSLGDPIEIQALDATLGSAIEARAVPLRIGNVKSRIGHLEAASGIAGVVKVVLALRNGVIPPSLGRRDAGLSPMIDWKNMNVEVPRQATSWPQAYQRRLAGVSSFGLSGTNAHAIFEAWQAVDTAEEPAPAEELVLVSARDVAALRDLALGYAAQLKGKATAAIASLAHTSRVGRSIFPFRLAVTGESGSALAAALEQAAKSAAKLEAVKPGKPIYRPATAQAALLLMSHLDAEFPHIATMVPELTADERLEAVLKALGIRSQKDGLATDHPALVMAGQVLPLLGKTSAESRGFFLKALAALFSHGLDLRLDALKAAGCTISPDLPVYAFQRQRFWIEEPRHQMDSLPLQNVEAAVLIDDAVSPERLELLQFVERELQELLRTDDALDASMTFLEVGGDSFIAMLLKKTVEQRYDIDLPLDALATDVPLEIVYGRIADHILSSAGNRVGVAAE